MNVENILKVADAIERHEIEWLGFSMNSWFDENEPKCGTTACIAGWAVAVEVGQDAIERILDKQRSSEISLSRIDLVDGRPVDERAIEFLGLDYSQCDGLFYEWNANATQAVAVLRHLAATGEVDWSITA